MYAFFSSDDELARSTGGSLRHMPLLARWHGSRVGQTRDSPDALAHPVSRALEFDLGSRHRVLLDGPVVVGIDFHLATSARCRADFSRKSEATFISKITVSTA